MFIGSATEHLGLAHAVQANLDRYVEATVWDQRVFPISAYPVDALLQRLGQSDFGIFVLAPSDLAVIRGEQVQVPRDNVVFELGMFVGRLGRSRAFVVVPREREHLWLPSDLKGLIPGDYDASRKDGNFQAALSPVCDQIRELIAERHASVARDNPGLIGSRLFTDYKDEFDELIRSSTTMTLYFIHSRRWRHNHAESLNVFFEKPDARMRVFLPDLANSELMAFISGHFDDELVVPANVAEAYMYFASIARTHPENIVVRLFREYPTYSMYGFDDRWMVALYPNARKRLDVPTFAIANHSLFSRFLRADIDHIEEHESRRASIDELASLSADCLKPLPKRSEDEGN